MDSTVPQSGPSLPSHTNPPVQNTVQLALVPPSTLNPASSSFVPPQQTQQIGGFTTATQFFLDTRHSPQCLLKTAITLVRVGDTHVSANVLFDEGAQRTFVTETLAAQLGANPHHTESLSISPFGLSRILLS